MVLLAAIFVVLTKAGPSGRVLPDHVTDLANGELLYHVGGCYGCHKSGPGANVAGVPGGGMPFPTPVGVFYPGNLTPDPDTGIGRWTAEQFLDAMTEGVSPDGRHYFPAFPYASYRHVQDEDLLDLHAYLTSLPPVHSPPRDPDMALLGLARRSVGLWKLAAFRAQEIPSDPEQSAEWNRGAYLVHGAGHCGECHTPRNALMVLDESRLMEGGPHPDGEGQVPGLRNLVDRGRYTDAADLTLALQYGETLGYDKLSSGGMAEIQMNLARLPEHELQVISEYLLSLR